MAVKYFKKINTNNRISGTDGVINWEQCAGGYGVLAIDDADKSKATLLSDLNGYADKRVGGVVRISPEIYDALKKKAPELKPSGHPLFQGLRVQRDPSPFKEQKDVTLAGAAVKPPQVETDHRPPSRQSFFARTRRQSEIEKADNQ